MKRIILLSILLSLLTGCHAELDNRMIVKEIAYCHNAGLDVRYLRDATGATWKIECVEKGVK